MQEDTQVLSKNTRVTVTMGALISLIGLIVAAAFWMQSVNSKLAGMERQLAEQGRMQKALVAKLESRFELALDLKVRVKVLERDMAEVRRKVGIR